MSLSERLRIAMRDADMSQAALARACNVKPPSVNGWLSGKSKFLRGENLLRAAEALRVRQQWLATGQLPMRDPDRSPTAEDLAELDAFLQDADAVLAEDGAVGDEIERDTKWLRADEIRRLRQVGGTEEEVQRRVAEEGRKRAIELMELAMEMAETYSLASPADRDRIDLAFREARGRIAAGNKAKPRAR